MTSRFGPHAYQSVPTLTEVLEGPAMQRLAPADALAMFTLAHAAPPVVAAESVASGPELNEEQVIQSVLAELQRQADLTLEYRLRESLGPVLARLSDSLVRDVRQELATTLRDVVARAVAHELARRDPH